MNNVVSQSVPHLHVHVVPRVKKDGLRGFFWPRTKYEDDDHAAETAAKVRERGRGARLARTRRTDGDQRRRWGNNGRSRSPRGQIAYRETRPAAGRSCSSTASASTATCGATSRPASPASTAASPPTCRSARTRIRCATDTDLSLPGPGADRRRPPRRARPRRRRDRRQRHRRRRRAVARRPPRRSGSAGSCSPRATRSRSSRRRPQRYLEVGRPRCRALMWLVAWSVRFKSVQRLPTAYGWVTQRADRAGRSCAPTPTRSATIPGVRRDLAQPAARGRHALHVRGRRGPAELRPAGARALGRRRQDLPARARPAARATCCPQGRFELVARQPHLHPRGAARAHWPARIRGFLIDDRSPGRPPRSDLVGAPVADVVGDQAERVDRAGRSTGRAGPPRRGGPRRRRAPELPRRQRPARRDAGMALVEPARAGPVAGDHAPGTSARFSRWWCSTRAAGRCSSVQPASLQAPAEVDVAGRADALGEAAELVEGGAADEQVAGRRGRSRPCRACPRPGRGSCGRARSGPAASPARRRRRSPPATAPAAVADRLGEVAVEQVGARHAVGVDEQQPVGARRGGAGVAGEVRGALLAARRPRSRRRRAPPAATPSAVLSATISSSPGPSSSRASASRSRAGVRARRRAERDDDADRRPRRAH